MAEAAHKLWVHACAGTDALHMPRLGCCEFSNLHEQGCCLMSSVQLRSLTSDSFVGCAFVWWLGGQLWSPKRDSADVEAERQRSAVKKERKLVEEGHVWTL